MLEWLTFQRVGLMFDIAGALTLALGLAARRVQQTALENSKFYREAPEDRRAATEQADAIVGLALLVSGFALQMAEPSARGTVFSATALLVLAVFLAVYAGSLRRRLIARRLLAIRRSRAQTEA